MVTDYSLQMTGRLYDYQFLFQKFTKSCLTQSCLYGRMSFVRQLFFYLNFGDYMKVFAVVFDYSADFCYECGHSHERYVDTLFTTREKAEQRLNKLTCKRENKGKVKIEEMVVGE